MLWGLYIINPIVPSELPSILTFRCHLGGLEFLLTRIDQALANTALCTHTLDLVLVLTDTSLHLFEVVGVCLFSKLFQILSTAFVCT